MSRRSLVLALCVVFALSCLESGGGASSSATSSTVGDLADTSYFGRRGEEPRRNALGEPVALADHAGSFVWAEYAAPWCGPCGPQAAAMKSAEARAASGVVFLTIMTSDMGGYGDPATTDTARKWAERHGLDPARVLAANLTAIEIPRHILFSPEGHTLYEHTGPLAADQIVETLTRYRRDWDAWRSTGARASWMHG